MSERLLKKALQLELKKNFHQAAEIYEELGRHKKAAFLYHKGGQLEKAVTLLISTKQYKQAARYCEEASDFAQAATLFEQAKCYEDAARAHHQLGNLERCAALYEKSGQLPQAARYYQEGGSYYRAGHLFHQLGENEAATNMFCRWIEGNGLEKDCTPEQAQEVANFLHAQGRDQEVALLLEKMGRTEESIRLYLGEGMVERAVSLAQSLEKEVIASLTLDVPPDPAAAGHYAQFFLTFGEAEQAGQLYEERGDYAQAALAYEEGESVEKAAECYLLAEDYTRAAPLFEKCQRWEDAADCFQRDGDIEAAARNFSQAGHHFQGGVLFMEMGDRKRTIEALQKVGPEEREFPEAAHLTGQALVAEGHRELALDHYMRATQSVPIDEGALDLFYDYATLLVEEEQYEKAKAILKQISARHFGYRGTDKLLLSLDKKREEPPAKRTVSAADRRKGAIVLSQLPLFEAFTSRHLMALWDLANRRTVEADQHILTKGSRLKELGVLVMGSLEARENADNTPIFTLTDPGEAFGVGSLLKDATSSFHLVAMKKTRLLSIDRKALFKFLEEEKRGNITFFRNLSAQLTTRLPQTTAYSPSLQNQWIEVIAWLHQQI